MSKEEARSRVRVVIPDRKTKTHPVPEAMLHDLESRYEGRGIRSGQMLLMKPADALEFAEEAGQLGIGILGPEFWYTPHNEYYPAPDYGYMLDAGDFVRKSVQQAKSDIIHALPDGVAWVSFVLASPLSEEDDHIV
jgi:hypothetical protein